MAGLFRVMSRSSRISRRAELSFAFGLIENCARAQHQRWSIVNKPGGNRRLFVVGVDGGEGRVSSCTRLRSDDLSLVLNFPPPHSLKKERPVGP